MEGLREAGGPGVWIRLDLQVITPQWNITGQVSPEADPERGGATSRPPEGVEESSEKKVAVKLTLSIAALNSRHHPRSQVWTPTSSEDSRSQSG